MNVLKKILEEIKEIEKEFVVGHEVLFALGATGMAAEIEEIIRSHMNNSDHNGELNEKVGKDTNAPYKGRGTEVDPSQRATTGTSGSGNGYRVYLGVDR